MTWSNVLWIFCCSYLLLGCSGTNPSAADAHILDPVATVSLGAWQSADPAAGRALFEQRALVGGAGCVTCHALQPNITLVGPSLYGIATTASTREGGVEASLYIYRSIVAPNEHVVEGFPASTMPGNYGTALTADEVTNLVSFLMTLTREE